MKLLEDLKAILQGREADPWKGYDPNKPLPKPVSEEDLEKAAEEMAQPKRKPSLLLPIYMVFLLVWGLGLHLYGGGMILYYMMGTPIAGGIFSILFAYILVELIIFSHYFILLNKERQNK